MTKKKKLSDMSDAEIEALIRKTEDRMIRRENRGPVNNQNFDASEIYWAERELSKRKTVPARENKRDKGDLRGKGPKKKANVTVRRKRKEN